MRSVLACLTVFVSLGLLGACSGSETGGGTSSGGVCGKPGRTGVTDEGCGPCSAGQYCDAADFHTCKPGCTSDANCGENEWCARCGSDAIGTCQSCSRTEADVCMSAGCTRDTFFDQDCVSPGKAYTCPTDQEPSPDLGTCTQTDLPGTWCCGGAVKNSCMRDPTTDMPNCGGDPMYGKSYFCAPPDEPMGDCISGFIPGMFCCTM